MKHFINKEGIQNIYSLKYKFERVIDGISNEPKFYVEVESDVECKEVDDYVRKLSFYKEELFDEDDFFICGYCGFIESRGEENYVECDDYCVCDYCLEKHYKKCGECGEYHRTYDMQWIVDEDCYYCESCRDNYCMQCDDCHDWVRNYQYDISDRVVCNSCVDENYIRCERCGALVYYGDACRDGNDNYYCEECYNEVSHLRDYHENPDTVFHTVEKESTDKYIGCEIETEMGDFEKRVEITERYGDDESFIYQMRDGSLDDSGIECITQPMSKKFFDQFDFEGWFDELKDAGAKSHDTNDCGLHVHLSKSWFGITQEKQEIISGICVEVMSSFREKLNKFARRSSDRWASYDEIEKSKSFKDKITMSKENGKPQGDRYKALNRDTHKYTYEFRIFRGTLNPETFRASVEMCIRLVDFSKWIYNHNKNEYSWDDFMSFKKMPALLNKKIEQFVK